MKRIKKILKFFIISVVATFLLLALDIKRAKINSVEEITDLRKIKLYDKDGNIFYEVNNLHESSYVALEDIHPNIIMTFIEIEDKRFYTHSGYDIKRIFKAIYNNVKNEDIIGASTITQQYVKNIYLSNEKTMSRKILELYYAIRLEKIYSKDEILEGYLNTIYFNHGIYGIYDATKFYFDKEPKDITLAEAATLTAIVKSPSTYSPITNFKNNQERKGLILKTLLQNKKISSNEYENSLNEEIIITKTKHNKYSNSVLFFKDIVLNEYKKTAIEGQNLEIHTSFDSELNLFLDDYLKSKKITSEVGIVVLNNKGEIISSINKDYENSSLNTTINSARMIGSTIKPMLYYEALRYGLSALSKFKSEPTTFYIDSTPYTFQNYNNKYNNSKITMSYAIGTSDNIYAVKTHLYIGSNKLISFLNKFNIQVKDNYPSLALGTQDMSLLTLTSIYNTFSRLGEYNTPYTIKYIDINKKRKFTNNIKTTNKLDSSYTYIINELLTNTFDTNLGGNVGVTGGSIANELNTKVSGKTGLTDFDSYMIGYTPLYTVGIWTGNLDGSYLNDINSKTFPKTAFLEIINYLSKENKNVWYKKPNDVYDIFTSPTGFNDNYQKKIYLKR